MKSVLEWKRIHLLSKNRFRWSPIRLSIQVQSLKRFGPKWEIRFRLKKKPCFGELSFHPACPPASPYKFQIGNVSIAKRKFVLDWRKKPFSAHYPFHRLSPRTRHTSSSLKPLRPPFEIRFRLKKKPFSDHYAFRRLDPSDPHTCSSLKIFHVAIKNSF